MCDISCSIRSLTGGHYCYLLVNQKGRTYIGYTNNPCRRIRQHNGIIQGGAKKTSKGRPWQFVCIVGDFPDEHTALSFEWYWQHVGKKKRKGCWTLENRFARLRELIAGKFKDSFLHVYRTSLCIGIGMNEQSCTRWYLAELCV